MLGCLLGTLTSHAADPFPTGANPVPNGAVWYLPHLAVKGTLEVVEQPGIEPGKQGLNPHKRYQALSQLIGGPYGSRSRASVGSNTLPPSVEAQKWLRLRESNPPVRVSSPGRLPRENPI